MTCIYQTQTQSFPQPHQVLWHLTKLFHYSFRITPSRIILSPFVVITDLEMNAQHSCWLIEQCNFRRNPDLMWQMLMLHYWSPSAQFNWVHLKMLEMCPPTLLNVSSRSTAVQFTDTGFAYQTVFKQWLWSFKLVTHRSLIWMKDSSVPDGSSMVHSECVWNKVKNDKMKGLVEYCWLIHAL